MFDEAHPELLKQILFEKSVIASLACSDREVVHVSHSAALVVKKSYAEILLDRSVCLGRQRVGRFCAEILSKLPSNWQFLKRRPISCKTFTLLGGLSLEGEKGGLIWHLR